MYIYSCYYSVLSASAGSIFKAFIAGYTDDNIPVMMIMIVTVMKNVSGTVGYICAEIPMASIPSAAELKLIPFVDVIYYLADGSEL